MTATKPKTSKKFKSLLAVLNNDETAAVAAWNRAHPDNQIGETGKARVSPEVKALVEAGFSIEEAKAALEAAKTTETKPESVEEVVLTSKDHADVLVAKNGLIHTRGRIYSTTEIIEAQVRVLKSGKPELVRTNGEHRTKAVIIYRLDDTKAVAVQNLGEAN